MSTTIKQQRTIKDWIIATRPWSFPASSMPVITTVAYLVWISQVDSYPLNWVNAVWALLAMVLFQAAGNLLSDYKDYESGVDHDGAVCVRIIISGLFTTKEVRIFGIVLLLLASCIGCYLFLVTGWPLLIIGGIGFVTTWFYYYLKYHAWGDFVIFIDYAILPILGTTYVVMGRFCYDALVLAVPVGLITVAILHANNTRDIETDRRANIRTVSIKVGRIGSAVLYDLELVLPYLWLVFSVFIGRYLPLWTLISLITFPMAWQNLKQMSRLLSDSSSLTGSALSITDLDEKTAKLQMAFSLCISLGLILSLWLPEVF